MAQMNMTLLILLGLSANLIVVSHASEFLARNLQFVIDQFGEHKVNKHHATPNFQAPEKAPHASMPTMPTRVEDVSKDISRFWENLKSQNGRNSLLDTLEVESVIGQGSFGHVFAARNRSSDMKVALKVIPQVIPVAHWRRSLTQLMLTGSATITEWYIGKYLRKHHVSGVVLVEEEAYALTPDAAPKVVQDELQKDEQNSPSQEDELPNSEAQNLVCFVEPLMSWGTLEKRKHDLSRETLLKCLTDVASTVASMHRVNVSHRDLKLKNILVEKNNDKTVTTKLSDFGSARISASFGMARIFESANLFDGFELDIRAFAMILGEAFPQAWSPKTTKMLDIFEQHLQGSPAQKLLKKIFLGEFGDGR